jgi:uncharacterized membrane protein
MVKKRKNKTNSNTKSNPRVVQKLSLKQKAADSLASWAGSWSFIFITLIIIGVWMYLNSQLLSKQFDPYPFILLNFVLSTLAALQAPIILMSQNRQTERDRINAKYDYQVNRKAEREILKIISDLEEIKKTLSKKK